MYSGYDDGVKMNIVQHKFSEVFRDLAKPFCKGGTEVNKVNITLKDKNSVLFEILGELPIDLDMLNNLVNLRNVDVSDSLYFRNSAHISYYLLPPNQKEMGVDKGYKLAPIYINGKVYADNMTMFVSKNNNKVDFHFNIDYVYLFDLLYVVPYLSILSKEFLRVYNTKMIMEDYSEDLHGYGELSFFMYSIKSKDTNSNFINSICSSDLYSVELSDNKPTYILDNLFRPNFNNNLEIGFDINKYI